MSPSSPPQTQSREAHLPSRPGSLLEQKAKPPRAPEITPGIQKALDERTHYQEQREAVERRSVMRGLLLLALVILVFSLVRAGADRVFYTGWWRQW